MDKLTNEMIVALANDLGLEPALLKAVQLKFCLKVTLCTKKSKISSV